MPKTEKKQLDQNRTATALTFTREEMVQKMRTVMDALETCTHGPLEGLAVVQMVEKYLSDKCGVVASYETPGTPQ